MTGNSSGNASGSRGSGITGVVRIVEAWFDAISAGVNRLGGFVVLPAMTTVMMIEVVARYVFNSPFLWTFELASHLLLLVFLCGVVECTRGGGHIRMDLVYQTLSDGPKKAVRAAYYVLGILVFALVVKFAGGEIPYLYSVPVETEYLRMPEWVFFAVLVLVAVLLIFMFVMRLVQIAVAIDDEKDHSHG